MKEKRKSPKMLTIKEACVEIRVCESTLFSWLREGRMKFTRLGGTKKTGKILIPKSEIDRILKSRIERRW